jgi:hypothetical protein
VQFVLVVLRPWQFVRKLLKVFKIIAALLMNAFVNGKMLPVFLWLQHMVAIWASKRQYPSDLQAARKNTAAYFAKIGTPAAGVVVYVLMGSIAAKAYRGFWDIIIAAPLDWADWLTVLPAIILLQKLPVLFLKLPNDWESVGFELLICGRVQVIKSKLSEWNIFRDKGNQRKNSSLKILNV